MAQKKSIENELETIQKQLKRLKLELESQSLIIQKNVIEEHTNLIKITTDLRNKQELIIEQNKALLQDAKTNHVINNIDGIMNDKQNRVFLYVELVLGTFLGIIGNFIVSLFFEPPIESTMGD